MHNEKVSFKGTCTEHEYAVFFVLPCICRIVSLSVSRSDLNPLLAISTKLKFISMMILWFAAMGIGSSADASSSETGEWFVTHNCSDDGTPFENSVVPKEARSYFMDDDPDTCIEVLAVTADRIDWNPSNWPTFRNPAADDYWEYCVTPLAVYCVCPFTYVYVRTAADCIEFRYRENESSVQEEPVVYSQGLCKRLVGIEELPSTLSPTFKLIFQTIWPKHHDVITQKTDGGVTDTVIKGFFPIDPVAAIAKVLESMRAQAPPWPIMTPGHVKQSYYSPELYCEIYEASEELFNRIHGHQNASQNWTQYHLIVQNCQHWAWNVRNSNDLFANYLY